MNVLFRCDASHGIGLGHVIRCLALADELKEGYGCHVTFAMRESDLGERVIGGRYAVVRSVLESDSFVYGQWLHDIRTNTDADVLVLDVRDGLSREVLDQLKIDNVLIVDIDDPEEKRFSADLVFYPPAPRVHLLDWEGFKGRVFSGWEWVILRREFVRKSCVARDRKKDVVDILVTMGGSDPMGMTLNALNALSDEITESIRITVVLGEGFAHLSELEEILSRISHPVVIKKNVKKMATVMQDMDLAVASFGMTAYELASLGIPAVYLCLTRDHLENADMFINSRLAYDAWLHNEVEIKNLSKVLAILTGNNYLKKQMDEAPFRRIDGNGAKRVADLIMMYKQGF